MFFGIQCSMEFNVLYNMCFTSRHELGVDFFMEIQKYEAHNFILSIAKYKLIFGDLLFHDCATKQQVYSVQ